MIGSERRRQATVACLFILFIALLRADWRPFRSSNAFLSKFAALKVFLAGYTVHYIISHSLTLVGLGPPDLPEHHYRRNFVTLRKLLTGLDAGLVSSLHVRPKWLRDVVSILLGGYFVIFSKKAEDRMHRFHQNATVEGVRACWNKGRHPLLWTIARLKQPLKIAIHRRKLPITRQSDGSVIDCYLYFQGSEQQLKNAKHVVINYPGGGFVAMDHRHHESYMNKWANYLHVPLVAVNYRKAPEHKYPAGFNDSYDVYKSIVTSQGRVLGIEMNNNNNDPNSKLNIVLCGDSAGGNLSAAVCCRAITENIQVPNGLLLAYAMLDCDMSLYRSSNYLHDMQSTPNMTNAITYHSFLPQATDLRKDIIKSNDHHNILHYMDDKIKDEILSEISDNSVEADELAMEGTDGDVGANPSDRQTTGFGPFSSRAQFFDDGVLPIKYLLVLGDAYIPTHADPVNDMFLSPLRAPLDILARFPPVRMHVGSVDPLVDDSRRFAQRLKLANHEIDVKLLEWEGLSHAYIQSPTFLLPQARHSCELSVHWISDMLGIEVVGKDSFKYDLSEAEEKTKRKSKL